MSALDLLNSINIKLPFIPDRETSKQRISTCRGCACYNYGACMECGCIVLVKTKLKDEKCPLGKW